MNRRQVEDLAQKLCKLDLEGKPRAEINKLIGVVVGDLDEPTSDAALARAAEIMEQRAEAAGQQAASLEKFFRLANATGCPPDANKVTWLKERGLIEDAEGGYAFTPKATNLYLIER